MRYASIRKTDVSNGPGFGVSLFVQGCAKAQCGHPCPGCFNSATWDPEGGNEFTQETQDDVLDLLDQHFVTRFSVLGGEPLDADHLETLTELLEKVAEGYPEKKVWLWTGFTFEQLYARDDWGDVCALLKHVDVLVDGPFVQEMKDAKIRFRGSSNQRVLDCRASLDKLTPVLLHCNDTKTL
jgi:anaerobic ribonucleoside-triphosphate reductase activating protein